MADNQTPEAGLFDERGRRKYLTGDERRRFLLACAHGEARTRALCRLLVYSGCRVSEALQLTRDRLDATMGHVVLRTLKRRKTVYRAVPMPEWLLAELLALPLLPETPELLFGWCRQTAWRRVVEVMGRADITGAQAMPKGLRHGFGIATAERNIPGGLVQRWMGHSRLETTAIYQDAAGGAAMATGMNVRLLWRRLCRAAGEGLCVFLAMGTSSLGWIPALTGLPFSIFLVATGIVSLAFAWRLAEEPS